MESPQIFSKHPQVVARLWPSKPSEQELSGLKLTVLHQVHGSDVHELDPSSQPPDGDGLFTNQPGSLLAMRVADCVAVLLYDPVHRAVAAVHSGWRGTRAGVVPNMIAALHKTYGTDPRDLIAYISPAGQVCDYEVGPEFMDYFPGKFFEERDAKIYFDNSGLVYSQLNEAGLAHESIEWDERCTIHDSSLLSYRRDKTTERMFVAIGLKTT